MAKTPDNSNQAKKAAILKELESVKALLNEDKTLESFTTELEDIEYEAPKSNRSEFQEEFQIPLLDPGKSTTYELDFSKPKPKPIPEKKPAPPVEPREEDIPMIDDITASSSLFDDADEDDDESYKTKPSMVTEKELKAKAQLIIQDLINDAITELEDKLDNLIPNLEERLKKRLEKAMDEYIEQALKK